MIIFICKIRREALTMKNILFKSVNTLLIGGGLVNSYNIIKYVNNKDYEITNRNISNFS